MFIHGHEPFDIRIKKGEIRFKSSIRAKGTEEIAIIVHIDNDPIDTIKLAVKCAMRFPAKDAIPSNCRKDVSFEVQRDLIRSKI